MQDKQTKKAKEPTISFVATQKIVDALNARAEQEERSISWLIRKALEQYLGISK